MRTLNRTSARTACLLFLALAGGCNAGADTPVGDDSPSDPSPPMTQPPPPGTPPVLEDGFEGGLDLWTKDAHVPPSVEDPSVPVPWSIDLAGQPVYEGVASACFTLDGRQDDGAIWLERTVMVAADSNWTVHVSGAYWSPHESFNTFAEVALYAGATSPEVESDFDVSGILNKVDGWKTYAGVFEVTTGPDGLVHIALGVNVVWETWITYFLDDVRVWIEPR
jgi:hypothetical protein